MFNITQIGMGYIGLTNAMHFAAKGHNVTCYDIDNNVINSINNGNPKSGEFLSYIQEDFKKLVDEKKIVGTSNYEDIFNKDAFFISVPTEKNDRPYMEIVKSLITDLVCNVKNTKIPLIIIESTLTPGFCRNIKKDLEKMEKYVDKDYYLVVAPRRDWFADPEKNLTNLRRVVGGLSKESVNRASVVIKEVCERIDETYSEIAEITKSLENTLLNAQISVIEYLSLTYPDVDINEAVSLATKGHWRLSPLQLNSGIGGRCIPLALDYLNKGKSEKVDYEIERINLFKIFRKTDLIYRLNICDLIEKHVENIYQNSQSSKMPIVVIFGLGYRKDFKDIGWSPGKYFYNHLCDSKKENNNFLYVSDPLFSKEEMDKLDIDCYSFDENKRWDILVLSTNHSYIHENFNKIMKLSALKNSVVIDACGALENVEHIYENLRDIGVKYIRVGSAGWQNV